MCPCGEPLHYGNPDHEAAVQQLVDTLGPTIEVTVGGIGVYAIPRHYLALHGLVAKDIDTLGFRKVL
jgi:hypothetical protein